MKSMWDYIAGDKRDLILVGGVVGILVVLFVPIPPGLLDFLLIANLSFALLVLLLTFYAEKPLAFSTFPSVLLVLTLFRVSLNISATRLILAHANAGHVIHAIGAYVVGGNYVIGLVVFLILIVVQYVVVTNGAQRVAEVAARFTLDSMPGKQMSIDADINMGIIDEHEAASRRATLERESNFYGAMDGATKFVKGDAIAGILIILIDIVGGLSVGIMQRGMSWGAALHTFTLLTVGDGIVTQIPALVIATATGILITRAATDSQLGGEIARQVLSYPRTLIILALALMCLLILPGIPVFPVAVVLALLAAGVVWGIRKEAREADESEEKEVGADGEEDTGDIYQSMKLDPIKVSLGRGLVAEFSETGGHLKDRLTHFRRQLARDLGFVVPPVQVSSEVSLAPNQYEVLFYGARVAQGELLPDKLLAINPGGQRANIEGIPGKEPTYGLPALWIDPDHRQYAQGAGYTVVEPETVLLTHFGEVIRQRAPELLTRAETEVLIGRVRRTHSSLVEELIPGVLSYSEVQKVLKDLLREKVSIRNLEAILEVLVDEGRQDKSVDYLAERVRERLAPAICQTVSDEDGDVHVLTLAPKLERSLLAGGDSEHHVSLFHDPALMERFIAALARKCDAMMAKNRLPVLLCPGGLRRRLRQMTSRAIPQVVVLGLNEIPESIQVRSFDVIDIPMSGG